MPASRTFEWITCGHPQPLLVGAKGGITELRVSRADGDPLQDDATVLVLAAD